MSCGKNCAKNCLFDLHDDKVTECDGIVFLQTASNTDAVLMHVKTIWLTFEYIVGLIC